MIEFTLKNQKMQKKYPVIFILSFAFFFTAHAQSGDNEWPLFRGKADLAGKVQFELPASPKLLWSIKTGARTK